MTPAVRTSVRFKPYESSNIGNERTNESRANYRDILRCDGRVFAMNNRRSWPTVFKSSYESQTWT